jgi:hypothetical protein
MRELFGQRPEPWIELQSNDQHPEAFTVTSEPIPAVLAVSPADDFDRKLSAIPQLSARMSAQEAPHQGPRAMPTVPFRVQADPDLAMTLQQLPGDLRVTAPRPGVLPVVGGIPPQPMPNMASASAQVPGFSQTTPGSGMPMRPHSPSVTPGSNPQYPLLSSASHAAFVQHRQSQPSMQPMPQESRRRIAIYILVPAVIVGVIIGLALGFGGKKKVDQAASSEPAPIEKEPEPTLVVEQQGDTPPVPEAAGSNGATATADTPATNGGATTDVPVTDTKPDTTNAKPETKTATKSTKSDKKPTKPEVHKPAPQEPPDVAELYKDKKYADVVATCAATSAIVSLNSTACTLAACKMKDATKAKKWFGSVGAAKKSSVQKECGSVLPSDKTADEACKRDPMACQR